ncbi:ABC-type uncharacterized transport system, permease component [Candidatus Scalindua japonica]|uniref:ABC-type uncharacterized transport system, permease component n=1 Tax=Candidatus Scalindua japonica TaxID=1284222 RepID=A0A286TUY1_9BACT|nr:hypothetical protein [Candidatus Scalindua japonica]GAX59661.1 ABC-type uncharacterized transport system, permease component [Candidatus Scalindua japonica]
MKMKMKILLFSMFVSMVISIGFSGVATAGLWSDNFGRTWDINFGACSNPANVICVSGVRDINNDLGCGALPLDGTLTRGISGRFILSVTAFDNPDNGCISSHWNGVFGDGAFTGDVSNELGPFGSFTLTPGASNSNGEVGSDPAAQ